MHTFSKLIRRERTVFGLQAFFKRFSSQLIKVQKLAENYFINIKVEKVSDIPKQKKKKMLSVHGGSPKLHAQGDAPVSYGT